MEWCRLSQHGREAGAEGAAPPGRSCVGTCSFCRWEDRVLKVIPGVVDWTRVRRDCKGVPKRSSMDPDDPSDGKNPAAVALGRLGGKKGGPARAMRLTAAQRSAIAKRAAQARWRTDGTS